MRATARPRAAMPLVLLAATLLAHSTATNTTTTPRRLQFSPRLAKQRQQFLKRRQRAREVEAATRAPFVGGRAVKKPPPPPPPKGERYDASKPPRVQAYYPAGQHAAGFGGQYLQRMAVFALCRRVPDRGCCYVHSPMPHDISGLKSDERCSTYEAGKAKNSVVPRFLKPNDIKWYLVADINVRKELRKMYDSVAHPTKQFECDYRIHARRGMHRDGLVPNATYVCLVRSIKKQDATAKICIFSEGSVEQFGELAQEDVTFVLNGDPAETFHGLVTAPNLFLGHSPLSHAAAMLATQAKVYTVPWEPGMSRAVANCWSPGDCSACYAKRKDNVPCCAPRNARVVDTLRNLNTWSLMGVTDKSYDRDPTGKGTWAPLPPEYEGEADWVKAWRKEESLYATKWVPPKPSYPDEGPDFDLAERIRRERGIKATPAPTQQAWDEKPRFREALHWAAHVARGIG